MVLVKVLHELVAVGYDLRLDHFAKQVVSFTGPFTNARKYRKAFTPFRDVVDQLHDQNGLAHAGTARKGRSYRRAGNGWTRSITLIPVSNISSCVACSSNVGA
jgi:hypothetical protein